MNTITNTSLSVRHLFERGPSLQLPTGLALPSLAAVLISGLGYSFYKWYRLSHIPGPFWTPYSLYRLLARGKLYEEFPALSEKYGKLPLTLVAAPLIRNNWWPARWNTAARSP